MSDSELKRRLEILCDAIQKDSQPLDKDHLYIVRPEWFNDIQSLATEARKLIHADIMGRKPIP
jgi:hypothetical protein